MGHNNTVKAHWSFWVIAIITLIWNGLGVVNFFVQMSPAILETYRESERAIIESRPVWATIGFAVAVIGGTMGNLLLLFRKQIALHLFTASFIGLIITMIPMFIIDTGFEFGEMAGFIFMPIVIAIFLIWYAGFAKKKRWIA